MQSILVVAKNKKNALDYAQNECEKIQIDKFDTVYLTFEKAIGVEDVRSLQRKLILKPLKSKTKAVIIEAYEGITIDSQNALLKTLEEPPNNTIIYITIQNRKLLLPTILSRCKIIDLKDRSFELSKKEISQYLNILVSLLSSGGVGDRLKLAQDIAKNKDVIIPELEKMIIVARDEMINNAKNKPDSPLISQHLNILISLNKTYTVIKTTNVNPRLTLENLFLNL